MMTYGISGERAFDILMWRSQVTNTKLRHLVKQLISDFTTQLAVSADIREQADHLLLTVDRRVKGLTTGDDGLAHKAAQ